MKITEVRGYSKRLPMATSYNMSRAAAGDPDSTIVELVTDGGLTGWGEVCPTSPLPQPEHAASIRADLALLGPSLVGLDPTRTGFVHRAMQAAMTGGTDAKSAIDNAFRHHHGEILCLPRRERRSALCCAL